ncbi:3489_t:CDS:2 [Paraglomus brasilianum]|uniref:3489_t:CDS:1 n=1 Tax=Paraglomus brasilianum TaxID=144538 RepID=A0A9N9AML4_9GLOM|nr:3489_t:CDS:2 [Paraglomus brasilianum]
MTRFQTLDRHYDEVLEEENETTLNGKILADIMALCQERNLPTEGDKSTLIKQLLNWKQNTKPIPAPSTPRLVVFDEQKPIPDKEFLHSILVGEDGLETIPYAELEIGRKLGSGGFKDCYEGKYINKPVAIGEIRMINFSANEFQEIKHEINVLKQLLHENVTRFIGVSADTKQFCLITELCEHGDLFDYMRRTPKPTISQQIMFMHDISLGVNYLHTRRPSIIHRDLKSMNILISINLRAKINDFGLARIRQRANDSMHTQCGTPNWQAPEFWSPTPSYTEKVDVYACALIFWEIMTWGEHGYPYQNYSEHQLYEAVRDKNIRPQMEMVRRYPQSLLELVRKMWQTDANSRLSMGSVVDELAKYLT